MPTSDPVRSRWRNLLPYLPGALITLGMVVLIHAFFPRTGKFKYEFEVGKVWQYDDLYAPFDFPINKSADQIEAAQAEVRARHIPHYRVDPGIRRQAVQQFADLLGQRMDRTPQDTIDRYGLDEKRLLDHGVRSIQEAYDPGILERPASAERVVLIRDNRATTVDAREVLILDRASERALNDLPDDVQRWIGPLVQGSLRPDLIYDDSLNTALIDQAMSDVPTTSGVIQREQLIIERGDPISEERVRVLSSFEEAFTRRIGYEDSRVLRLGYLLLIASVLAVFALYMVFFDRTTFRRPRPLFFLLALISAFVLLTGGVVRVDPAVVYAIPYAFLPVVLLSFFKREVALFSFLTTIILSAFLVPDAFRFMTMQFAAGSIAVFANDRARYWTDFFTACGYILLAYLVTFLGFALVRTGTLRMDDLMDGGWLVANAFLVLLAYPFIPLFERLLGAVSNLTLAELGDLNKPLLRDLSLQAPGTFQHSLQVANLAEAAANELGANTLLVKTGALYHDIGKMKRPEFFIENQYPGENPHDGMEPAESARVIIEHVTAGVTMARSARLPQVLIDFIATHHGTSLVRFFYHKAHEADPATTEAEFRYPGPRPFSRETAIVMMADAVEAASRSLATPTAEHLDDLVDRIIRTQIEDGQFDESDITFRDIDRSKRIFKKMLAGIYHVRVAYPEEASS